MSFEQSSNLSNESSDQAEFQDSFTYSSANMNIYESKLAELQAVASDPEADSFDKYMAEVGIATTKVEAQCVTVKEGIRLLGLLQKNDTKNEAQIEKVSSVIADALDWIRTYAGYIESQYGVDVNQILDKYGVSDLS